DRKIGIPDVAAAATWNYGELITGTGAALKPYADVSDDDGSVQLEPHSAISYAACVADVEVDDETGEVRVERLIQVYDVGRAINPTLVEGQIEGGAMMGLGLGLLEEAYPYYPGTEHRGAEFGAYLAPTLEDLPDVDNLIIENPSEDGPFGAKAIGEMANNAQPPAIVSAIYDGVTLHAIGGEQILLCRVTYEPGKQVPDHAHEYTEQVMAIVDGEASVTVAGETHDVKAGDVVVINRGVRHSVSSAKGLTF